MLDLGAKIAAARRYAPPLVVVAPIDRRGARLRQISRRAIDYTKNAGLKLLDVYPDALTAVRRMAPAAGTPEATNFVASIGLTTADVYPPATVSGERRVRMRRSGRAGRWRWAWAVVGAAIGGVVAGPIGLAVGGGVGLLGGRVAP